MGYCGSGGSGRRRALMDKFQEFLENIDESRAVCPEGPCGPTGACASFGRPQMGPVSSFNPPRAADYLDPNKRPLITSTQVEEIRPTSDHTALRSSLDLPQNIHMREVGAYKWKDRPTLLPQSPETIQRILENKEKGYPPPGEKNPYLYRSPFQKPKVLRPRTFPPHFMGHRAGMPCEVCDPPVKSGTQKYPPEEEGRELEPERICPAHLSAPCGQLALSLAAGCPPIQSHSRFVPDPQPAYLSPYQMPRTKQLSVFHIPALLENMSQFDNSRPYTSKTGMTGMQDIDMSRMYDTGYQYIPVDNSFVSSYQYNSTPRPGTCGTCMDPKPPRTTCPSPCGEPCPAFHPVNLAFYTDPMEPPICKTEFLRQPPCVDHFNKPCGAHKRLKNNCEEFFGRPCKLHYVENKIKTHFQPL